LQTKPFKTYYLH